MTTAILILAAGASTRMGEPKQLLAYKGTSLLGCVVKAALEADCGPVAVVLGANGHAIRNTLDLSGVYIVHNATWDAGIGSSISTGVAALRNVFPGVGSVLILLGDQPLVDAALIRRFIATAGAKPGKIIAAAYNGTVGVPAAFPANCFADLQRLDPSGGAKSLLERRSADLELIAMDANPDIDTPAEYRELIG